MKKKFLLCALLFYSMLVFAQQEITGTVTDERGAPIEGASVKIKDAPGGTSTNALGFFRLSYSGNNKVLVISFVDKESQEISIGTKTVINANLKNIDKSLDEVVITGYGQQSKRSSTASMTKLGAKTFENTAFTSVEQLLQGRVAGLQMQSPTGQPGAIQQIRIRGIGSITAGAAPLWVIDGIPVNTGDFSLQTNSANTLAGINTNDIESVTVLKDASATSIYGARAANGVILVTTKKGKAGKPVARIDTEYGTGSIAYWPSIGKSLTRDELRDLTIEGMKNAGFTQVQIDNQLNTLGYNSTANYNWLDLVTRAAKTYTVNGSVSGGDANTQYFFSGGYYSQEAVVIGSDFQRYSVNMSVKQKIGSKLSIAPNLMVSYAKQRGENEGSGFRNPVYDAKLLRPSQEAFNPDGTPNYSTTIFNNLFNPLAIAKYDTRRNNTYKILGGTQAEYKILENLKLSSKLGVDFFTIEEYLQYNPFFGDARTIAGYVGITNVRASNWIWTNLLDYNFKALKGDLTGYVKIGYEAQKSKRFQTANAGSGLPLTFDLGLPSVSTPTSVTAAGVDYSLLSQFSSVDLSYQGKYNLSGSFRRDGSSVFGANNRYANFWSVGASWNIDRERFMAGLKFISLLKLRSSYGLNGNASIGEYVARDLYTYGSVNNYQALPGSAPNTVGNPDLTWEINKPFDIGLEAGLFNNKVNIEIDYYKRTTESLLLNVPLSLSSGFGTSIQNLGKMENKGWEFTVNATPIARKDLTWNVSFNISLNRNKLLGLNPTNNNAEIVAAPFIRRVGHDYQTFYLRQWAGADPATGSPLWYVDETKATTTSTPANAMRVLTGSASPTGFGSVATSLSYHGFSLEGQLNYQYGNYIYDQWEQFFTDDGANTIRNKLSKQLRRWQKPGDVTDIPKYIYGNSTTSNTSSTRYLYKGDYLRLRTLVLTYDVAKSVMDKIKMKGIRFYVKGTNLFTKADKNLTVDPELTVTGLTNNVVPPQRVISIGVNLNF